MAERYVLISVKELRRKMLPSGGCKPVERKKVFTYILKRLQKQGIVFARSKTKVILTESNFKSLTKLTPNISEYISEGEALRHKQKYDLRYNPQISNVLARNSEVAESIICLNIPALAQAEGVRI